MAYVGSQIVQSEWPCDKRPRAFDVIEQPRQVPRALREAHVPVDKPKPLRRTRPEVLQALK